MEAKYRLMFCQQFKDDIISDGWSQIPHSVCWELYSLIWTL